MYVSLGLGFYDLCLGGLWPWLASYYRLRADTDGKYSTSWRQRLGLRLPGAMPAQPRVWYHALSLGEVLSSLPLVRHHLQCCPDLDVAYSAATESGRAAVESHLSQIASSRFVMPHDFPWSITTLVRNVKPTLFVLIETDLWPNLLHTLKHHGTPVALVNARFSERSYRRLSIFRKMVRPTLANIDLVCTQSERDQRRFRKLGVPSDKVHAVGNLKYDLVRQRKDQSDTEAIRAELNLPPDHPVWIAGSSHPGEEQQLLSAHLELRRQLPDLLLILAPRHPHRAKEILALCESFGLSCGRRSIREPCTGRSVYLVDTLGELSGFYGLARAAFIGGSLIAFGGHNPLEAVVHGIPACWGPHLSNFREIESELLEFGCGSVVADRHQLSQRLMTWLSEPRLQLELGARCRELFAKRGRAAHNIVELLTRLPRPTSR